jgi:hypothetical protein
MLIMKSKAYNILFFIAITGLIFSCKPKSDVSNTESGLGCNMNYTAEVRLERIIKASRTDTSNMFSVYPMLAEITVSKILKKGRVASEELKENIKMKVFFNDFEKAFRSEKPLVVGDIVEVCLEYHIPESYHHVAWFVTDFKKMSK